MNEENNQQLNIPPTVTPPVSAPYTPAPYGSAPYSSALKTKPEKKLYPFNNKDFSFLIFAVISIFAFARLGVLELFNLGFSVTYLVLYVGTYIYVHSKVALNKGFNSLLFVINIVLSVSFALHDNEGIKLLTVLVLFFLTTMSLNSASGTSLCNDGTFLKFADVMYVGVAEPLINMPSLFSSLKQVFKTKNNKFAMVIGGVLISVPVLFIVVPLLSSADTAFNTIVKKVFENVSMLLVSLVITVILLPFVSSYGFSLANGVTKDKNKSLNSKEGKASPVLLNTFLCVIGFIYVVFLVSQLAYITDAFAFLLPDGFSASEFARSGFFQMGAIAFINLLITFIVSVIEKQNEKGRLSVFTKVMLTFFTAFSIFLTVNAFIRMSMYIDMYGLTELRVLTSIFMVMLCVVFVIILIRIFNEKFKYANLVILTCALTFALVSVGNIDGFISKYNYQKYIEGEIELDFEHYRTLGNSAVPELIKIAKEDESNINRCLARDTLADILCDEFSSDPRTYDSSNENYEPYKYDDNIFGFNLARYKGGKALEKYFDDLLKNNVSCEPIDFDMYEYESQVASMGATSFMPDFSDTLDDIYSADFWYNGYEEDTVKTVEVSLVYDEVDYKTAVSKINGRFEFGESEDNGLYTFKTVKNTGVENCVGIIAFSEKENTIIYLWAKCDDSVRVEDLTDFVNQNFYSYFGESYY